MKLIRLLAIFLFSGAGNALAATPDPFRFESMKSTGDMRTAIEANFPLGSPRTSLRKHFVEEGSATQKIHPSKAGVEKYIYDMNLCSYYIWRWNISADFDSSERLLQAYVNGEPVFSSGPQKTSKEALAKGGKASIIRGMKPRPEATKGEKALAYIMLDTDSDTSTMHDQLLMGGGPTRADPFNMGKLHVYSSVEPWRSIFDADAADRIVDYQGDCSKVDEFYARQKTAKPQGK